MQQTFYYGIIGDMHKTVHVFIIVKTWKQPKFPSTENWMDKL